MGTVPSWASAGSAQVRAGRLPPDVLSLRPHASFARVGGQHDDDPKVTDAARWFAARPLAVYATIFAIYLIARVIIVAGGEVFQSWDSAVYAYRDDPTRNRGPLISFIGHAPRPWGLPLFFAMFPTDEWRAIGQSVLGVFAWTVLAWELTRHRRRRPAKYAAFASVLLFSSLTNVTAWDFTILTESTSVSFGVLIIALLMRWARTDSWIPLALATVIGVWWTFIRPDIRVFTVVLIGLLAVAGWRVWRRRGAETAAKPRLLAIGASMLVLGLGIAWYAAIEPSINKTFAPYDGDAIRSDPLPADEELFVYRLRVDVSTNPEMWQAYKTKLGLPTCPEVEAFTHRSDWASVEWAQAYRRCQPRQDPAVSRQERTSLRLRLSGYRRAAKARGGISGRHRSQSSPPKDVVGRRRIRRRKRHVRAHGCCRHHHRNEAASRHGQNLRPRARYRGSGVRRRVQPRYLPLAVSGRSRRGFSVAAATGDSGRAE